MHSSVTPRPRRAFEWRSARRPAATPCNPLPSASIAQAPYIPPILVRDRPLLPPLDAQPGGRLENGFAADQLQIIALVFMAIVYTLKIRWILRFPAGRDFQAGSPEGAGAWLGYDLFSDPARGLWPLIDQDAGARLGREARGLLEQARQSAGRLEGMVDAVLNQSWQWL